MQMQRLIISPDDDYLYRDISVTFHAADQYFKIRSILLNQQQFFIQSEVL